VVLEAVTVDPLPDGLVTTIPEQGQHGATRCLEFVLGRPGAVEANPGAARDRIQGQGVDCCALGAVDGVAHVVV